MNHKEVQDNNSPEAIQQKLNEFHGSHRFYECLSPFLLMSEGVNYLTEAAKCHWLVDALPPYLGRCGRGLTILKLNKNQRGWRLIYPHGLRILASPDRDSRRLP